MPKSGVRLPKQTDLPAILLILAISIAGMAMLRQSTPFGLGLNTDSVYYVNGARNMLAGNGFYRNSGEEILKPITHFPPLFSAILSGEEKLTGLDPLRGGRLVIILLYGLNAILFAWLVYELTGSRWPAVIAAGLMVFSPVDLRVYAWLMSEPAYLCLNLLALLAAWRYFKSRRLIYAVILGVLAGLMYLTRYVGISLMAAGLSCFLVFERSWPRRWAGTGLFLVFSLPAVIGVALRNYRLTGSIGNRTLVFHPAPFVKIAHGIQSFWGWFLPSGSDKLYQSVEWFFIGLSFILLVGVLGMIVWRLLDKFRGRSQTPLQEFLLWVGMYCVLYLVAVYVTMNFFDATTVLDDRMLMPLYQAVLLVLILGGTWLWKSGRRIRRGIIVAGVIGISIMTILGSTGTVVYLHQDGLGFLNKYWRESPTMQYIRENDIGLFYTNQPPTIYILTGKSGYMVPSPYDSLTLQERPSYREDLALMKEKITAQDGLLIFFLEQGYERDPWYLDLTAGLEALLRTRDAIIWERVE